MHDAAGTSLQRALVATGAALTVCFPICLLLAPSWVGAFSDIVTPLIATLVIGVISITTRRTHGPLRQAWTLFALSAACTIAGDLMWAALTSGGREPPSPAISDIGYLLQYPVFLLAALRLPTAPFTRREAVRAALDLSIAFLGAAMVVWQHVVRPLAELGDTGWSAQLVAAAYPVGDLMQLAALGLLLIRQPTRSLRGPLRWLAVGIAVQVAADFIYARMLLAGTYVSGRWIDGLWMTGSLLLGVAALTQPSAEGDQDEAAARLPVSTALPFLGIALGFGLIAQLAWQGNRGEGNAGGLGVVLVGAALLCALVILRQVLAMREISALTVELQAQNLALRVEQERSERLLLNILPASVAARLKQGTAGILADQHLEATVLFADLVGFTKLAATTVAPEVVRILNDVFSRFDHLAEAHGLEKIKTIGDAYMAVCGVPEPTADHASPTVRMGLAILEAVAEVNASRGLHLEVRVGIHSGPLVAGVIGERKFIYDLWGDTVNVASRMESHGLPNRVHISDRTRALLDADLLVTPRGMIDVRGRGPMPTWFVDGDQRSLGPSPRESSAGHSTP